MRRCGGGFAGGMVGVADQIADAPDAAIRRSAIPDKSAVILEPPECRADLYEKICAKPDDLVLVQLIRYLERCGCLFCEQSDVVEAQLRACDCGILGIHKSRRRAG